MKRLTTVLMLTSLAAVAIPYVAPAGGAKAKKTELEGTWNLHKGGKGAPKKIVFKGNTFVLTFSEERVMKGTFKVDTDENPSWIDLKITTSPVERFKGKVSLGIYKFDGEGITWCGSIPGRKRRPQQFLSVMGDARLLLGSYRMKKK